MGLQVILQAAQPLQGLFYHLVFINLFLGKMEQQEINIRLQALFCRVEQTVLALFLRIMDIKMEQLLDN